MPHQRRVGRSCCLPVQALAVLVYQPAQQLTDGDAEAVSLRAEIDQLRLGQRHIQAARYFHGPHVARGREEYNPRWMLGGMFETGLHRFHHGSMTSLGLLPCAISLSVAPIISDENHRLKQDRHSLSPAMINAEKHG